MFSDLRSDRFERDFLQTPAQGRPPAHSLTPDRPSPSQPPSTSTKPQPTRTDEQVDVEVEDEECMEGQAAEDEDVEVEDEQVDQPLPTKA